MILVESIRIQDIGKLLGDHQENAIDKVGFMVHTYGVETGDNDERSKLGFDDKLKFHKDQKSLMIYAWSVDVDYHFYRSHV